MDQVKIWSAYKGLVENFQNRPCWWAQRGSKITGLTTAPSLLYHGTYSNANTLPICREIKLGIDLGGVHVIVTTLQQEIKMSRASTEMEQMRNQMVAAVDKLSPEDLKAMLLRSLELFPNTYVMNEMANATSFKSFEKMDFELDLTP